MKSIMKFESYLNNKGYWDDIESGINLIQEVLDTLDIISENIVEMGETIHVEKIELAEWEFTINEWEYSILIVNDDCYDEATEYVDKMDIQYEVLFFTLDEDDPSYNMDATYIECAADLMEILVKLKGNPWLKGINEKSTHIDSYKIFEKKNTFVNLKTFDLEKWYTKLNKELFGGKLEDVPLRWNQAESALGVVKWDEKTNVVDHLGISDRYKLTEEELLSILAHEMIHVWQIQNRKTDGHGNNFIKEMERINKKNKWGINVKEKQPLEHLKMTNPDLKKDFGFIIIKNGKSDYDITTFDPDKTDYGKLLAIIQHNIKNQKSIEFEVRMTQNGLIKQYKEVSDNEKIITYKLDELTFNSLMISSKKIYGGNIEPLGK